MIDSSVRYLKGVGPKMEVLLNRLGIYTLRDLLCYFPFRYEDRTRLTEIKDLKPEGFYLIRGKVLARNLRGTRKSFSFYKGQSVFETVVSDNSGKLNCVWFNQPFLSGSIKVGAVLLLYGKVTGYKGRLQFTSPEFELYADDLSRSVSFGRIVGFYHLTEGLTQKRLRAIISEAVKAHSCYLRDPLPVYLREQKALPDIEQSVRTLHMPEDTVKADQARERLIFEELFLSQLLVHVRKAKRMKKKGIPFKPEPEVIEAVRGKLGFSLTPAQQKALAAVLNDMQKPSPMHRLIQGDVGSGKTVVAVVAAAVCAANGYQASLMVPTEVLAWQHYHSLIELSRGMDINVDILVSSLSSREREQKLKRLAGGNTGIIVGTHALAEKNVKFKSLGLVIIDEEHKFGVAQRALLPEKGINPDYIVMSATPIPRSLALSLYGDLDLSVIDQLPPGRKQPRTTVVPEEKRQEVYSFLGKKLAEGRQAYIVYPVIEESRDEDLLSLKEMYGILKDHFPGYRAEVFHGRMKKEEKQKVMESFRRGSVHLLVATTVIEVGVNIENASVMLVENPERFGLAQLHQLRGRIRRSVHDPYFILIARSGLGEQARQRLSVLEKVSDGFIIAEEDLKLRGPGDFFGRVQWGYPQLKQANPVRDIEVLEKARQDARRLIAGDPGLKLPEHRCIKDHLRI